ncbi:MAG TPA: hypothetical protein ENG51_14950, partial [Deltaproteobacteria bacterium]|nr:hypothetical protein [Deltaproteobacteria bacterium]
MKPGPKKQSLETQKLKGFPNKGKKHAGKEVPAIQIPMRCPSAPKYLENESLEVWKRVAPKLHKAGLLHALSVDALGAYCLNYVAYHHAVIENSKDQKKYFDMMVTGQKLFHMIPESAPIVIKKKNSIE